MGLVSRSQIDCDKPRPVLVAGGIAKHPARVKIIARGGQTLRGLGLCLVGATWWRSWVYSFGLPCPFRAFARLSVLAGWFATPLTPCGSITLRVAFCNTFAPVPFHLWRVGLWSLLAKTPPRVVCQCLLFSFQSAFVVLIDHAHTIENPQKNRNEKPKKS